MSLRRVRSPRVRRSHPAPQDLLPHPSAESALTPSVRARAAVLGDLFRLDTRRPAWAELSAGAQGPAPSPRSGACMAATDSRLYVFGGRSSFKAFKATRCTVLRIVLCCLVLLLYVCCTNTYTVFGGRSSLSSGALAL